MFLLPEHHSCNLIVAVIVCLFVFFFGPFFFFFFTSIIYMDYFAHHTSVVLNYCGMKVETVAQFGVIFLLFALGLEFSATKVSSYSCNFYLCPCFIFIFFLAID